MCIRDRHYRTSSVLFTCLRAVLVNFQLFCRAAFDPVFHRLAPSGPMYLGGSTRQSTTHKKKCSSRAQPPSDSRDTADSTAGASLLRNDGSDVLVLVRCGIDLGPWCQMSTSIELCSKTNLLGDVWALQVCTYSYSCAKLECLSGRSAILGL